jgi:hypothetical protein
LEKLLLDYREEFVMLRIVGCLVCLLLATGCGGGSSGPVKPPQLSADQEKAIMDRVNQTQQQEGAAPAAPAQP